MARVKEGAMLMTVTEKGSGRRTSFDQYRLQSRGGKGIRNYKVSEEKGFVAAVKAVTPDDDVIMITDGGIIIRINSDDVTQQSRYGSGVRVMRVPEGGRIVTLARVQKKNLGNRRTFCLTGKKTEIPARESYGSPQDWKKRWPGPSRILPILHWNSKNGKIRRRKRNNRTFDGMKSGTCQTRSAFPQLWKSGENQRIIAASSISISRA